MPLSSTKRRLRRLWKKQKKLDQRIDEAIRRRLRRFCKGRLSSEEFEKATREELSLARLNMKIFAIKNKSKPKIM